MLRNTVLATMPAIVLAASAAGASELNGAQIIEMLTGNSIVHPDFGCAHYPREGRTVHYLDGSILEGDWSVRGDIYYSNGQCGLTGCRVTGAFPEIVFRRLDGRYVQPAQIVKGNYCKRDGVIS